METKVNHEQKINDIVELIRELNKVLLSVMVSQVVIESDNYLLVKAVVDSMMRDRPYYLPNYKEEFDNIHSI